MSSFPLNKEYPFKMNFIDLKKDLCKDSFVLSIYFAFGFFLDQVLHTRAFFLAEYVVGLPKRAVPIPYAYLFSLPIWLIAFFFLRLFFNRITNFPRILLIFLVVEICSQIFSRSVIKLALELLLAIIVYTPISIEKHYGREKVKNANPESLKLLYNEIAYLLRLSTNVLMFLIGTGGVAFATQFLQGFYKVTESSATISYAMRWYGTMIIYIVSGMFIFLIYRLYERMVYAREELSKNKNGNVKTKT